MKIFGVGKEGIRILFRELSPYISAADLKPAEFQSVTIKFKNFDATIFYDKGEEEIAAIEFSLAKEGFRFYK